MQHQNQDVGFGRLETLLGRTVLQVRGRETDRKDAVFKGC